MTVIICVAGAVVGLFIGIVSGWLVLTTVLRTWDSRPQDFVRLPLPFAPTDVRELKALITDFLLPQAQQLGGPEAAI